ncbi:hypothetical protein BaRGS_00014430 [Batillaria attramentaria]|uniref:Uncharacterized protein n=1 Tax=Batillaria attramentaria TaxID=370345 RepID=A0ABD0L4J6_9CAEN
MTMMDTLSRTGKSLGLKWKRLSFSASLTWQNANGSHHCRRCHVFTVKSVAMHVVRRFSVLFFYLNKQKDVIVLRVFVELPVSLGSTLIYRKYLPPNKGSKKL